MTDYFVYVLPIALFLINILIFLVDRKDRKISNVTKKIQDSIAEIDNRTKVFRSQALELETSFAQQEAHSKSLIQTIASQLRDIQTYSDDLGRLRVAMKNYENALDALAQLTEDADRASAEVRENTEKLSMFSGKVEDLRNDFDTLVNQVTAYEEKAVSSIKNECAEAAEEVSKTVESLKSEASNSITDFKNSADEYISEQIDRIGDVISKSVETAQSYIEIMDSRLKALEETSKGLDDSALHILNDIGDRAYSQVKLNAELEALNSQREKLTIKLESLGQQIAERQTVNSEMEEVSRLQADRLASIKTSIQQLEAQRRQSEVSDSQTCKSEVETSQLDIEEEPETEIPEEGVITDIPEGSFEDEEDEIVDTDPEETQVEERGVEYTGEDEEIVFD